MITMDEVTDLVFRNNGQALTTSKIVAKSFNKEHRNVVRDIWALQKDVLNFSSLFIPSFESDFYGRKQKIYVISRKGFILLVMGYTGNKALQLKIAFIDAFDSMEKLLVKNEITEYKDMIKHITTEMNSTDNHNSKKKLYLISDGNNIKIGISANPDVRLSQLETGGGNLTLLYASNMLDNPFDLETRLHTAYQAKQVYHEWYKLDEYDVDDIKERCGSLA